jgi:hypothetical protein
MLQPSDLLSSNFHAYDFAEHVGQRDRLPDDPVLCGNLAKLACEGLQPLRAAWQKHLWQGSPTGDNPAIKVICGWRSLGHNAAVGGAPQSMHLEGLAADICCDVDWRALREGLGTLRDADRMEEFAGFVEKFVDHGDIFGGFGIYRHAEKNGTQGAIYWVHLDLRVCRWTGVHVGDER